MNVGRIRFTWADVPCVATLDGQLKWSCEPPRPGGVNVAEALANLYGPSSETGPERGEPGFATIQEAAEWLEGEVFDLKAVPQGDPYAVY